LVLEFSLVTFFQGIRGRTSNQLKLTSDFRPVSTSSCVRRLLRFGPPSADWKNPKDIFSKRRRQRRCMSEAPAAWAIKRKRKWKLI